MYVFYSSIYVYAEPTSLADTPMHLLADLSANTEERPMKMAGDAEKMWTAGARIEGLVRAQQAAHPDATRGDCINRAVANIRLSAGPITDPTGGGVAPRTGGEVKGGEDSTTSLLKNADTIEMMIECRWALDVFSEMLGASHCKAMSQDTGASFTAHSWLSIRTLLKVSVDAAPISSTHMCADMQRRRGAWPQRSREVHRASGRGPHHR